MPCARQQCSVPTPVENESQMEHDALSIELKQQKLDDEMKYKKVEVPQIEPLALYADKVAPVPAAKQVHLPKFSKVHIRKPLSFISGKEKYSSTVQLA
eukprot:s3101_g3.t1